MPTQAYFQCSEHSYPSTSEDLDDFTSDMPNYIHSTYQAACDALKDCCRPDLDILMLSELELLPFLCSEKGHGVFKPNYEDQCAMIQLETCKLVYNNSYQNHHLSTLTTALHHNPTTDRHHTPTTHFSSSSVPMAVHK